MELDVRAIDETVLALLYLTLHERNRAWKGHEWGALDRLHAQGYIDDPINKAKSVVLTEEGLRRAEQLFNERFVIDHRGGSPAEACTGAIPGTVASRC
ncbi:MAG TPA: DUF6429 family protein [Variovorax sp.]|nr:DUF6429 family protein [Variovorax sp.]